MVLARVHLLTEGRIPLIGIGGINSGAAAIAKIEAGATLLQLYTGLVYEGPGLIARIKRDLVAYVERHRLARDHRRPAAERKAGPPMRLGTNPSSGRAERCGTRSRSVANRCG